MTDLVARCALWLTVLNFVFALGLLSLTLVNLHWQWSGGASLVTSAFVALLAGYYALTTFNQLRNRRPLLVVSASGLHLPSAAAEPIAWTNILHLRAKKRLIPTMGGQLEVQVDPETFLRLKFGQRFMGDFVIKGRGLPNTFMVLTQGLDQGVADIEAAIKRHWPPGGG